MVTVDGNQKAVLPKCRVNDCRHPPIRGNQHKSPNPFCQQHQDMYANKTADIGGEADMRDSVADIDIHGSTDLPEELVSANMMGGHHNVSVDVLPISPPLRPATSDSERTESDEILEHTGITALQLDTESTVQQIRDECSTGCRDASNVQLFYNTTAGFLFIVRPCGIIVSFCPLWTCESLSQAMYLIHSTFEHDPGSVKFIGYDRGCQLEPYLRNVAAGKTRTPRVDSVKSAKDVLSWADIFVDRMHIKGHVNPLCQMQSGVCRYHPDLPRFATISGAGTEMQEVVSKFFNKYKGVIRNMNAAPAEFLLTEVIEVHNSRIHTCNNGRLVSGTVLLP